MDEGKHTGELVGIYAEEGPTCLACVDKELPAHVIEHEVARSRHGHWRVAKWKNGNTYRDCPINEGRVHRVVRKSEVEVADDRKSSKSSKSSKKTTRAATKLSPRKKKGKAPAKRSRKR